MPTPTRPGRRIRLDRGIIVDSVLRLTRQPGVSTVSVRDLGTELGADPTAIYRHFKGKDQIVAAALDRLHSAALESVGASPEDWRRRLRKLVGATLDLLTTHPAIGVEAASITTDGPGERDAVEFILEALTRAGLPEEKVVRYYAVLSQYSMSSAAGLARAAVAGPHDTPQDAWFESAGAADAAEHPLLAKFSPDLEALTDRAAIDFGLELILASAEREAVG